MTASVTPVLGILLSTASGFALVSRASGAPAATLQAWLGRLALGAAVGLGVASFFTFAWLFGAGALGPRYPLADAAACLVVAGGLLCSPRTRAGMRVTRLERSEVALAMLLVLATALAAWRFAAATEVMPHGEWDAWEVWNYRARQLFRSGAEWRAAFAPGIKSTEYPLLLPLASARLWTYGGESTLAPALVAGVFTLGSAWIVAGLTGVLAGHGAGAAAGFLLLGTSGYQSWGALQYADVPLATFVAAAAGTLLAAARAEDARRRALLVLGGALLGLAGWTKTEGVVVAILALAVFAVAETRRAGRHGARSALGPLLVGASLPALAWLVQHVVLSPELAPVLTEGQEAPLAKLVDPSRWSTVFREMSTRLPGRDLTLPIMAIVLAWLLGSRPRRLLRSPAFWLAGLMVLADVLVFVLTPLDLEFHLLTAADRLLLQPWPLFVLAVFAARDAQGTEPGAAEHSPPPGTGPG